MCRVAMNRGRLPICVLLLLLLLVLIFHTVPLIIALKLPLSSHHHTINDDNSTSHILQDVLKEISESQNWESERITDWNWQVRKVMYGTAQKFEFRIRFGEKSYSVFKFPDEIVGSLNKFNNDFRYFVRKVGSSATIDSFTVEGPFDLRVAAQHDLSLSLPLNASHTGLKRILVGEGITVEVKGAQELSLFHTFGPSFTANRNVIINRGKTSFYPFSHSLCMPLLPIQVIGSASLIAYRTGNSDAPVETTVLSKGTIELQPAKCYSSNAYRSYASLNHSLILKIDKLGKLLKTFLGDGMGKNWMPGFLRANVKASTIVRFQLELEKNVGSNRTLDGVLEDWKTRPTVERVWFEVLARVEAEKLRPITVKKVRRFIAVDSASWSNLMSNISFTKFPSILVPPEALTLDVKW